MINSSLTNITRQAIRLIFSFLQNVSVELVLLMRQTVETVDIQKATS